MRKNYILFIFIFLVISFNPVWSQISGTVFRDFNNNGTRQNTSGTFVEPGVKGVIVNAYNSTDAIIASYFSDSIGAYAIPASGSTYNGSIGSKTGSVGNTVAVRLEFILPTSTSCVSSRVYDFSSYLGSNYGTSVRFVSGGATNVNFAINNPVDYVFDASPFNSTFIFLADHFSGNPLDATGNAKSEVAFWKFPYSRSGGTPPSAGSEKLAIASQIGTVYGVAYSPKAGRVFTSAYMKRHSGFGPGQGSFKNSPGAIYIIDPSKNSTTDAATYLTSLDSLGFPTHNATGTPAYGSSSYSVSTTSSGFNQVQTLSYPSIAAQGVIGSNYDRNLAKNITSPSNDPAAFGQVGTVSLGDLEISDDGKFLFVTNLYDRKVYQLQLNSVTNPTSATYVNSWSLPNPPARSNSGLPGASTTYGSSNTDFYNGTKGYQRPFALKYSKGKLLVGAVTTGENGGTSTTDDNSGNCEYTDLWSYIWELTPASGFSSTPVLQFAMNYFRDINEDNYDETWKPWSLTTPKRNVVGGNTYPGGEYTYYPTPMLTDIELDVDGSMILGFRDRTGDQNGTKNYLLTGTSEFIIPISIGDMLRAYKNPTSCGYELEENGKEGPNSPKAATAGKGNKEGPGKSSSVATATNVTGGNQAWSGFTNINEEDGNAVSTGSLSSTQTTQNLRITGFSLNINNGFTSGASVTILGITAKIVRKGSVASSIQDNSIRLVKAGTIVGSNLATTTNWPTSFGSATYGSSSNLWGTTWTAADLNASNFGINIQAKQVANAPVPSVDFVEITVNYRVSVTLSSVTTNTDYVVSSLSANAGEFYYQDGVDVFNANSSVGTRWHSNTGLGSFALLPGTGEVVSTQGEAETLNSGGLSWMNNTTGANTRDYRIQTSTTLGGDGKTGGIGDLELLGQNPPIEIGNRVWNDANADGIQTANESGISGVLIELLADFNNDGIADTLRSTGTPAAANSEKTPTTITGNTGTGTEAWTNPSNVSADDGSFASTASNLSNLEVTKDLIVSNYGFTIPSNATITGIEVIVDRRATAANNIKDKSLRLIKGGTVQGNDKASTTDWPTTFTAVTYGSSSDLWGSTWTPSEINASNFGASLSAVELSGTPKPEVDVIKIKVYYTTPIISKTTVAATTTSNSTGEYYFNTTNVADGDTTFGNQAGLVPNSNYIIRLASSGTGNDWDPTANGGTGGARSGNSLAGFQLTKSNILGNGESDLSDNDALMLNSIPTIAFTTGNYGENNHSYDFGFDVLASLGDRVWLDENKDGVQDASEKGVAGITVILYKNGNDKLAGTSDDKLVAAAITDAFGNYLFDNLTPTVQTTQNSIDSTSYNVRFTLPANYQFTTQSSPGDNSNNTNSDANIYTGRTSSYNLVAGESDLTVDAGIIFNSTTTASVGDYVWFDTNSDDNQDAGEPGVSGVTVSLLNSNGTGIIATAITDANGYYLFTNVPAGSYRVGFSLPPGTKFTGNSGSVSTIDNSDAITTTGSTFGKTAVFSVNAGEQIRYVDAGIELQSTSLASIGDYVWYDNNRDGSQDANETGVGSVIVHLKNSGGSIIASTTTDDFGYYIFNNLSPANYRIQFIAPTGLKITTQYNTSFGNTDSDPDATNGNTVLYSLVAGERNMTVDCGLYSTSSTSSVGALGDYVWFDADKDGVQDNTESGVSGIRVILYNSGGTAIDTTSTDNTGYYLFPNLTPGNYSVGFSNIPLGYLFTSQDLGGNDNLDSDPNIGTGRTSNVTVSGGATNSTLDAGFYKGAAAGLGSLGNRVWYDLPLTAGGTNGNGIQDIGETGVSGVTVELLNGAGNSIDPDGGGALTQTLLITNALGEYMFTGLSAGNYKVKFSNLPSGYTLTTTDVGSDDAVDSDGGTLSSGASTTGTYALAQGEDNLTVDLGIKPANAKNALGNYVWFDADSDGIQDATEIGVQGVTVNLFNNSGVFITSTSTNINGEYLFTGISDGTYSVGFSNLPVGFNFTTKSATNDATGSDADIVSGRTSQVTLGSSNRVDLSLDAGLIGIRGALGNYVWNDIDKDGIQDANEPPIPGVTVSLYAGNGTTLISSTVTNQNGLYLFANLNAGNYVVGFSTIPDMIFTTKDVNSESLGTDSDVDPSTGKTASVTLAAGQVDLKIDAGLYVSLPARIGNFVWSDLDKDGVQDAGENGVSGVLVLLYNSSNVAVGSAVTNGDGYWEITNVPTGTNYYLVFNSNIPGFDVSASPGTNPAWTTRNVGTNGTSALDSGSESDTDSDVIKSGGSANKTSIFNIVPGNNFPNMDAGIVNATTLFPVPVTWLKFNAALVNTDQDVLLNWSTATETNNSHFEVERSYDGKNFIKIATVKSKSQNGFSSEILDYSDMDRNVATLGYKSLFYRIKQIDYDGKYDYTSIEVIHLRKVESVTIYPNPVSEVLNIRFTSSMFGDNVNISITDLAGKIVYESVFVQSQLTTAQEAINLKNLNKGYYTLSITDGINTSIFKFLKQ